MHCTTISGSAASTAPRARPIAHSSPQMPIPAALAGRVVNRTPSAGPREGLATSRPPLQATAADSARRLFSEHPGCAHLMVAALARDHGPQAGAATLITALARHHRLVAQVDEQLTLQGQAGYRALQRRLQSRAAWVDAVTVFRQMLAGRTARDLERSVCREDARAAAAPAETPLPIEAVHRPAMTGQLSAGRTGCGVKAPAVLATLMLAAATHGANASPGDDQYALLPSRTLPLPLRSVGLPMALVAAGSTLLASGTALWWLLGQPNHTPDDGTDAALPGPAAQDALRDAFRYLAEQRTPDGETLLERELWREVSAPGDTSALIAGLSAAQLDQLQRWAGDGTPLGPWLATLLELDEAPRGASALPRRIRAARSIEVAPLSSTPPAAASPGPQIRACRAIQPSAETLPQVEEAVRAVTGDEATAAVADNELMTFSDCLQRLQHSLGALQARTQARQQAAATGVQMVPDVTLLRRLALGRVLERLTRMAASVRHAQVAVNQRLLSLIG